MILILIIKKKKIIVQNPLCIPFNYKHAIKLHNTHTPCVGALSAVRMTAEYKIIVPLYESHMFNGYSIHVHDDTSIVWYHDTYYLGVSWIKFRYICSCHAISWYSNSFQITYRTCRWRWSDVVCQSPLYIWLDHVMRVCVCMWAFQFIHINKNPKII